MQSSNDLISLWFSQSFLYFQFLIVLIQEFHDSLRWKATKETEIVYYNKLMQGCIPSIVLSQCCKCNWISYYLFKITIFSFDFMNSILNPVLHKDPKIPLVAEVPSTRFKSSYSSLHLHTTPLVQQFSHSFPGSMHIIFHSWRKYLGQCLYNPRGYPGIGQAKLYCST
jgi:hypothetical protein